MLDFLHAFATLLIMTIQQIVNTLKFNSYAHNRFRSPDISPRRWAAIYGLSEVALMEFCLLYTSPSPRD